MATTTTRKTSTRSAGAKASAVTPTQALHSAAGTEAPALASGSEDKPAKLRKKEFVDRVVIASGMRKRDVKPIVEAALKALGEALDKGEQIVLPDIGNMRVANSKETGKGLIHTVKLRRPGPSDETVADGGDAG